MHYGKKKKAIYENVYLITTVSSNNSEKDYILGNTKFGIWGERQSLGTKEPTDKVILERSEECQRHRFSPSELCPTG